MNKWASVYFQTLFSREVWMSPFVLFLSVLIILGAKDISTLARGAASLFGIIAFMLLISLGLTYFKHTAPNPTTGAIRSLTFVGGVLVCLIVASFFILQRIG